MSIWQRVGGFVYNGVNLTEQQVAAFADAGGGWIVPVIYGDDVAGPGNLELLPTFKAWGAAHNVTVGGWFNGFGASPTVDAANITALVRQHALTLVILDLEGAYQGVGAELQVELVNAVRHASPGVDLGVSTNGLDNSRIWNGRGVTPQESFAKLGVRVLPQAYSAYYAKDAHTAPDVVMKWLQQHGASDPNFADPAGPHGRGVPLSTVHFTVECTGEEGSDLADEQMRLHAAKQYGFTIGYSLYTLERAPASDLVLVKAARDLRL